MSLSTNSPSSIIASFFTSKKVFLTGVTGFVGKVILYKILSLYISVYSKQLLNGIPNIEVIPKTLEDVGLEMFQKLEKGNMQPLTAI